MLHLALLASLPLAQDVPPPSPAKTEVALSTLDDGWRATLALDTGGVGVWTVGCFQVFPHLACPEIVGLDDEGRAHVLVSYSGKWTPRRVVEDQDWLGGLAHADVDPRVAGEETYVGGQRGNLYQVIAYPDGALDNRRIARFPGRELHTLVAGELVRDGGHGHVLVFCDTGELYVVSPTGEHGTFASKLLDTLPGRVRDAKLLPGDGPVEVVTASRSGEIGLLTVGSYGEVARSTIHASPMGKGRLAVAPRREDAPLVVYSTQDDGVVLRHERADDAWTTEPIYAGPQGPRGLAAGRFDRDPDAETVAVFGYARQVQLLTRREGAWTARTLFEDTGKGHWLLAAELDSRNATDELVASGYAGRVVVLTRPPGYGLEGLRTAAGAK